MSKIAKIVISELVENGLKNFVGVPCSMLKGAFQILEESKDEYLKYIPAVREDSAVGVASGIYLSGQDCAVLMQNSGLGYCLNVLTSLNLIYKIPVLLIISWRGADGNDAIEHKVIGKHLTDVLASVEIPYVELDQAAPEHSIQLCIAKLKESNLPVVLLVKEAI